jgi:membrane fusion protein (multidrug efflux system)
MTIQVTSDSFRQADPSVAPVVAKAPRVSRKKLIFTALALAVAVGGAFYARDWWVDGRFLVSTDDAYVGGDVTLIAPKVAGFIADVAVEDNQVVKAGDVLFRLDDRDYRAALARAEATVAVNEAALTNLDATRHLQEAMIAQAQAEVVATAAETARTHFDVDRYRTLSSSKYASEQRFEQADADYKKAAAAGLKANAAVDAAKRQIDVIDTQKHQAHAALDQAIADRDVARLNLSYTVLRAPIDGMVGNRSARTGAYATVGAGLVAIVPARGLWVDANFKENQLAEMRPGESVNIIADVLPGETFTGHVVSLAPATGAQFSVLPPENATGNFTKIVQRVPVRIQLDGEAGALGRLRPGLSVTAYVDRRDKTSARSIGGLPTSRSLPVLAAR